MLFRVWVVAAGAWCCVGAEEVCTSEGAVELAARAVTLYGQGDFDGAYLAAAEGCDAAPDRVAAAALWVFHHIEYSVGREAALRHFVLPALAMDAASADASRGVGLPSDLLLVAALKESVKRSPYYGRLTMGHGPLRVRESDDGDTLGRGKLRFYAKVEEAVRRVGPDAARHALEREEVVPVAYQFWASQLEYLRDTGIVSASAVDDAIRQFRAVGRSKWLHERWQREHFTAVTFSPHAANYSNSGSPLPRLGSAARPELPLGVLGAYLHRRDVAWPASKVALGSGDFAAANAAYKAPGSRRHVAIDGLLSREALAEVRAFCLESTLFFEAKPAPYLGAYSEHGFWSELLLDIADELRAALPDVIGDLPLTENWAYAYATGEERLLAGERAGDSNHGIGDHCDPGAININLWIAPDESNLQPDHPTDHGGIAVYTISPPKDDRDYSAWNAGSHTTVLLRALVPDGDLESHLIHTRHRQNRAVIFDSDYVHHSAPHAFKSGHANRRINLTFLFGVNKRLNKRATRARVPDYKEIRPPRS